MSIVKPAAVALAAVALMSTAACGSGKSGKPVSAGGSPTASASAGASAGGDASGAPGSGASGGSGTGGSGSAGGTGGTGGAGTGKPGGGVPGAPGGGGGVPALVRCHTAGLKAVVTGYDAGAGQRYARVVFTNTSGHPCRLFGWPGLGLGSGNEGFGTNVVRVGSASAVEVDAGGKAFSALHWTAVPASDETGSPQCEPTATVVHVIPPDETDPIFASWSGGPVCQHNRIEAKPIAAGTGG